MRIPKPNFVILLLLSALLVSNAVAQKTNLTSRDFKQLAGAAEEIPQMRLLNPADTGLKSKTALLPIAANRAVQKFEIPIENSSDFKLMLLAPNSDGWQVRLALPNEDYINLRQDAASVNAERTKSSYGLGDEQFPAEVFTFKSVSSGVLRVEINNQARTAGFLVISSESPTQLYSYVNTLETVRGNKINLVASLFDNETGSAGNISEALARIETPNGEILRAKMFDDGNHDDKLAGDGVFGGAFVPNQSGKFVAQIVAKGTNPNGETFIRTGEHIVDVAASRAVFDGNAFIKPLDDTRFQIDLTAQGLKAGQKIIAHAEVWGRDASGIEKAIAWIGGMTLAEKSFGNPRTTVPLTLDARWLIRSDAKSEYELRNIRVQNADSLAVLGTKETIALPEINLSDNLNRNFSGEITNEMRTGVRPVKESEFDSPNAVGGKLMLVHGYCSGDAWGAAASAGQFTNYVKFLDLNQNRSHDQFAQRIRNFGANLPSFGIVAHSQGGAASLHLYTYYWSGLDYATGTRLIQSVGTPYQGTAIAGNLAAIGSVFGAGCGSNYDLTYSGAAAWLTNIPTWARAKVFYHTTSFTDVWWRYDYCSLATDLFLGDPEDGVVERAYAQLPGANNLGHKTGWCHTGGMRDPAQTTDASRNANMNANAAR